MVELFNDGLETNDTSKWTTVSATAPNTIGSSTDFKHHGEYSLKAFSNAGFTACSVTKNLLANYPILYVRFYFLTRSLPAANNQLRIGWISDSSGAVTYSIRLARVGANYYFRLINSHTGITYDSAALTSPTFAVVDTWMCIEYMVLRNAVAGEMRGYLNGVEVLTVTGIDTGDNDLRYVALANVSSFGCTVYFDCIVIKAGDRIFCEKPYFFEDKGWEYQARGRAVFIQKYTRPPRFSQV